MGKKLFVIGDIHGTYDKFMSLMEKINSKRTNNDLLVFLGDYIDRGPDSFKVVEYIIQLQNKICLLGNHESMLQTATWLSTNTVLWFMNSSSTTKKSYREVYPDLSFKEALAVSKHEKFYKNLKLFYETDDFFFVHAGVNPYNGIEWSKKDIPTLTWIREDFLEANDYSKLNKIIVHGHTININGPTFDEYKIGLDTGSFLPNGKISCVIFPNLNVLQSE